MLSSSPASSAGRLDLISDEKGNSAVRLEAGLNFGITFTRVAPPGYSQPCAKGAALLLDDALFAGVNLDRPAAWCVSTMPVAFFGVFEITCARAARISPGQRRWKPSSSTRRYARPNAAAQGIPSSRT